MRILVVEDDKLLNNTLCYNLSTSGYDVDSALSKAAAVQYFMKEKYELVILDVNLPDGNGFDLCGELKMKNSDIAVIFLTARDLESDQLRGFELGADDYVTKPFPMSVFQKKVSALLSRIQKHNNNDCYDDGKLVINFSEMSAKLLGEDISFTAMEYRILKIFTSNTQIVLTRRILLEKLWDVDGNFVDEHALTCAVSRIRGKIERDNFQYIKTVYGMGYMWIGGLKK
ncbi:MAG: response regulator transcription factor [Dorea sp.]|jgi:two-component system OmpR family response regulator|nr:response regulator transcription factor [Dorea sp.]GFI43045.1 transcriptional activator protein CopR [Lachnospiraceae bacterium]